MIRLESLRGLVLDMDGVLWQGETPAPGLIDFFATLETAGLRYVLATNNATRTPAMVAEKLARFGVTLPVGRIVTSAEATADYLRLTDPAGSPVYVVGEAGLHEAIRRRGFSLLNPEAVRRGARAKTVVVGFSREFTYDDLAMGALLVRNGARFIATNPDPTYPTELGPLPGAGAIQAVIVTATGIPPTVIGKPGRIIFDEALRRLGTAATETAAVGDRLNTDIAGGQAAGLGTILVLSGVTSADDLAAADIRPDLVVADIMALSQALSRSAR